MVPFASIFFAFTNTVGAALWAADIEGKGTESMQLQENSLIFWDKSEAKDKCLNFRSVLPDDRQLWPLF
jgi:hypothetical protein